jgi:hypothetical protein
MGSLQKPWFLIVILLSIKIFSLSTMNRKNLLSNVRSKKCVLHWLYWIEIKKYSGKENLKSLSVKRNTNADVEHFDKNRYL